MWAYGRGQTHRHTDARDHNTFCDRLRLTQNVTRETAYEDAKITTLHTSPNMSKNSVASRLSTVLSMFYFDSKLIRCQQIWHCHGINLAAKRGDDGIMWFRPSDVFYFQYFSAVQPHFADLHTKVPLNVDQIAAVPIPRCIQYRKIGTPLSLRVTLHFVSFIRSFISDGVSRHVSRLETVSRHGFLCLGLGSVLTLICLVLSRVSSFHVSSCHLVTVSWLCLCQA